jgi:hypothetical protein
MERCTQHWNPAEIQVSEPESLADGFPGCHRPQRGGGWTTNRRLINWVAGIVRRAIAQPARSAVATAALGLIVGVVVRTAVVRHCTPNAAAGAVDPAIDAHSADRHSLPAQSARKRSEAPRVSPATAAPNRVNPSRGEPLPDGWIDRELDPLLRDLLDQ